MLFKLNSYVIKAFLELVGAKCQHFEILEDGLNDLQTVNNLREHCLDPQKYSIR